MGLLCLPCFLQLQRRIAFVGSGRTVARWGVSPETQTAWPVRQSPLSSACPSSGHSPGVLPDPKPQKAEERSSAGSTRPRSKRKKATKQPQSPEFSASVQPQSPEFSAAKQPKTG